MNSNPEIIYEADVDQERPDYDNLLTWAEWWLEFQSNACCPDPTTAAKKFCGCGGSGTPPSTISRLLARDYRDEAS